MGQAPSAKSRASGSTTSTRGKSRSELHLLARKITDLKTLRSQKILKLIKMTPALRRVQAHEDINMGGVQIESQQPAPAPASRRPRASALLTKPVRARSVIKEILSENRNNSYTFDSKTIEQQARAVETFVGDAHYYNLTSKKALATIHGTYVIVYARPVICEQDERGCPVAETFEPDIKNTLCIFTQELPGKNEGQCKVNEHLNEGAIAVGMLHFRSRNLTILAGQQYDEEDTIAYAHTWSSPSSSKIKETDGAFEGVLKRGPLRKYHQKISFGASISQTIKDNETGYWVDWGFEFVSFEFAGINDDGQAGEWMVIGAKIPERPYDAASRFILNQRLSWPFNMKGVMVYFPAVPVVYKKKRVPKVVIAPRPQNVPFKSNGTMVPLPPRPMAHTPGLGSGSKAIPTSKGKTIKRWSKANTEEEDPEHWGDLYD